MSFLWTSKTETIVEIYRFSLLPLFHLSTTVCALPIILHIHFIHYDGGVLIVCMVVVYGGDVWWWCWCMVVVYSCGVLMVAYGGVWWWCIDCGVW